jgi:hypothetical protein
MSWIAGFCGRSGGCAAGSFAAVSVCHLFDAYLHTTSSVLVHRATVSVGLTICGYACAACVSEWCAWFPWISRVVCMVCVVRFPTIARACHAACDAHLVPTLRALHHRVPRAYKRAHVPGRVGGVCCVPRNTRFPRADFFLLMGTC